MTTAASEKDWDLGVLLAAHHDEEEAHRLFVDWLVTFAPLGAWVEAAVRSSQTQSLEHVWTLEPVTRDTGTG